MRPMQLNRRTFAPFVRALASLALSASASLPAPSAASAGERTVHLFAGGDGAKPAAPLIADAAGALFGTTVEGGSGSACRGGCGTVFKLTPGPHGFTETLLHEFAGGADGAAPYGGLIADANGALYGTAAAGGSGCGAGCGVVYKLTPAKGAYVESIVYAFGGGLDGSAPRFGSLIADASGALYGTTQYGGGYGCHGTGCGTVFKLTPHHGGYAESILYRFQGGFDGESPLYGVIADAHAVLYGTTAGGGGFGCERGAGCGTVFSLTPERGGYRENIIYRFTGGTDGAGPNALTADAAGALFGTTVSRGVGRNGTVFKLTATHDGYLESTVFDFGHAPTGSAPAGNLLIDAAGALYGTTLSGGAFANGTVYKLTPSHGVYRETVLYAFRAGPADGGWPQAGLVADGRGALYGTVSAGGNAICGGLGCGAAFEVR
jgi:uncharacterized repeat protein (TIGR03803 family)